VGKRRRVNRRIGGENEVSGDCQLEEIILIMLISFHLSLPFLLFSSFVIRFSKDVFAIFYDRRFILLRALIKGCSSRCLLFFSFVWKIFELNFLGCWGHIVLLLWLCPIIHLYFKSGLTLLKLSWKTKISFFQAPPLEGAYTQKNWSYTQSYHQP